jgi:hypothetical protein
MLYFVAKDLKGKVIAKGGFKGKSHKLALAKARAALITLAEKDKIELGQHCRVALFNNVKCEDEHKTDEWTVAARPANKRIRKKKVKRAVRKTKSRRKTSSKRAA